MNSSTDGEGGFNSGLSAVTVRKTFASPLRSNTKEAPSSDQLTKLSSHLKRIEDALATLDKDIYEAEEAYMLETPYGNLIKGWDGFLDSKTPTTKKKVDEKDRMFSHSCWTQYNGYQERLNRIQAEENQANSSSQSQKLAIKRSSSTSSLGGSSNKKVKHKKRQLESSNTDKEGTAGGRKRSRGIKRELSRQQLSADSYDEGM
mmetsp:Transcript_28634/g.37521  ORF Transcript_28634/g.37521 Transcript_28634/m.37521 type:complete len:203 (+) Transcript_28634:234-842(+)